MKYLCMIYQDEAMWAALPAGQRDAIMAEYGAFTDDIGRTGHLAGGEQLHPSASATTVRMRRGQLLTTDGPFIETTEQLGGFYLIEARDLNEAIQVASRIPSARLGAVEIRPVVEGDTAS